MRALHVEEVIQSLKEQVNSTSKKPVITKLFINNIVLVKASEYFEGSATYTREEIAKKLYSLLKKEEYKFENREIVMEALHVYGNAESSFSDCLQSSINKEYFCFDEEMEIKAQPSSGIATI